MGMGHFGQIVPNNIYNKYVYWWQHHQTKLSIAIGCLLLYNIVPLPDILPLHQIYDLCES
jgi:hypothetical protein